MELVVIWIEYRHEKAAFNRGIIRPPDKPSILLLIFGLLGAGCVAVGVERPARCPKTQHRRLAGGKARNFQRARKRKSPAAAVGRQVARTEIRAENENKRLGRQPKGRIYKNGPAPIKEAAENSEKRVPRGLKPARSDKKGDLYGALAESMSRDFSFYLFPKRYCIPIRASNGSTGWKTSVNAAPADGVIREV